MKQINEMNQIIYPKEAILKCLTKKVVKDKISLALTVFQNYNELLIG